MLAWPILHIIVHMLLIHDIQKERASSASTLLGRSPRRDTPTLVGLVVIPEMHVVSSPSFFALEHVTDGLLIAADGLAIP